MNKKDSQLPESAPSKLLSICMIGRDDDYTHDFIYRITTTLNHTARSISNLGQMKNIEILITDWGSKTPMAQTLNISEEASRLCRFIYVQPELIRATQNGEEYFHTVRAINVGIRRATGRFILIAPCDQLIQQHSLDTMLSLLDGKIKVPINVDRTLLMLPRIEVPWTFIEHQPSMVEWDRYMFLNEYSLARTSIPYQNQFSGSGGILLHRDIYYQLGGFDEINHGWGWSDNEFGFRASQAYPHLWLSSIGVFVFDMGHKPIGCRQLALSNPNPEIFKPFIEVNDNSWGLVNHELEVQRPQFSRSDLNMCKTQDHAKLVTLKNLLWFSGIPAQLHSCDVLQHVIKNVGVLVKYNQRIDRKDINALLFLSWYSINHFPRSYVEFGVLNGCSAGVVVSASPSVEVYLIDRWEGELKEVSANERHDPIHFTYMLYDAGLRGYLQFINGEISTAIERLRNSFVGTFGFDLALVRVETFGTTATQQISDLANSMAPAGALILTCESESNFKIIWNELQRQFPKFSYFLCGDQKTGMILSASPAEASLSTINNLEIKFADQWFTMLLIRNKRARQFQTMRAIVRRIRNALRGLMS